MGLLKLINPTHGMPQEHKDLVRLMKLSAGSKRRAAKLLEKALEIRKNGYGKEETAFLLGKIAEENAYKPNFGERFFGMTHESMVSDLTKYLMNVEPLKDAPIK